MKRPSQSQSSLPVSALTRDHIIWAYRLFLEREPESEQVIQEKLSGLRSIAELRTNLLISDEFLYRNTLPSAFNATVIVIKELEHGLRLYIDLSDEDIGVNIALGCYEKAETSFISQWVKANQTVLDIGANIGYFTILLAHLVGDKGHVYVFEPLKRNMSLLLQSIAENNFADRATIVQGAVGNYEGMVELISPRTTHNWGGPYLRTNATFIPDGYIAESVRIIPLDHYSMLRPINFIKIDIEGAELLALMGAKMILQEDRPLILAEVNPVQLQKVSGCTANEFIMFLQSLQYRCYLLGEDGIEGEISHYERDDIKNVIFSAQNLS